MSWRAVLLTLALIPLVCFWVVQSEVVTGASLLVESSLLIGVVFILFVAVLLNMLLRRLGRKWVLRRQELLTIYLVLSASVGLSGISMTTNLVLGIGTPYYYANEGNRWAEFHPSA